ncbi:MAG: ATP-dependent helicase, partial [Candidatus Komeilibacteria bacterium]|nr:ATP-dependent helicase [Candidatus Komeilibacteria bacterium]
KTHGNVLVVGDDAQSIYSFRAADISHILNFPREHSGAKIFKIETNYRSTQPILELANEVIAHNVEQFKKKLVSPKKSEILPKLVPARTGRQEAQFIVQMILQLIQTGERQLSEMAVLFRAAFHSQMLELELAKANIPYDYRGGTRFFARAHIKDVLAFLKIIHNVHDEVAWSRILSLQPGIGPATIKDLWQEIQRSPDLPTVLARSYSLGAKAGASWKNLAKFLSQLVGLNSLLPAELMNKVLASDYRDYLEAEYPDFKDRLQDLEGLVEFAGTYDTLEKFLAEVTLEEMFSMKANQEAALETDRLVLSTIHQAKGLEWPVVFVLHLTEAHFPNPRALKEENGLEEERRLFYVAITRAADLLFLTYPQTSADFNLWYQPSPFLQEVDFDLFEEIQLVTDNPGFKQNISDNTASFLRDDTERVISLDSGSDFKPKRPKSFLPEIDEL